jgi:hypothetical protein
MSRAEKFALYTAIIGLLANVFSIVASGVVIAQSANVIPPQNNELISRNTLPTFLKTLSLLVVSYSWFVISWFLIRRYFLTWSKKYKTSKRVTSFQTERDLLKKFGQRAILTIGGVGALLAPVFLLIEPGTLVGLLLFFFPVGAIWSIVYMLMPIIYPDDMDIDELFTAFFGY